MDKRIKNVEQRWEQGIPHDPRSEKIAGSIAKLDKDDYFDFKFGGDGDNGEELMYLLDIHFELEDEEHKTMAILDEKRSGTEWNDDENGS